MRKIFFLLVIVLLLSCNSSNNVPAQTLSSRSVNITNVPIDGNTYITSSFKKGNNSLNKDGIADWNDESVVFSSWFKTTKSGMLGIFIRARASEEATIRVSVKSKVFDITLKNKDWAIIPVGLIVIGKSEYVQVDFKGLEKKGETFGEISEIIVSGESAQEPLYFVREFSTYWGRRGPSVHLQYTMPENENIEYFYNEVTVPEGNDVIGSYYMANGFNGGYFGMQVNSERERRVLFSVWSPYETQDPKDIPEEYQVKKLMQGEGVHIGEFGNEGSGGQSYLIYPWKAGVTYKFLTQIHPDGNGNTIFTSHFYATDEGRWRLIASFIRPKTDIWYQDAYSFLENFIPNQGYITRKVLFDNQWVVTNKGKWLPVSQARFTYDATAKAKVRQDYKGGLEGNSFFLQNCGFFNDSTAYNTPFERIPSEIKPDIDLKKLNADIKPLLKWSTKKEN